MKIDLSEYSSKIINRILDNMPQGEICNRFVAELTEKRFKDLFGNVEYDSITTMGLEFRQVKFKGEFSCRVKNDKSVTYAMSDRVKLEHSEIILGE